MTRRILVIEDHPTNMNLMAYRPHAFGYEVQAAYDGMTGIASARHVPPDVIICDAHLPMMDGYEIVRQLKDDPVLKTIPVAAVTALAMEGDREKLLSAGFDTYIGKPLDPQFFIGEIEGVLHGGQNSRRA